MEPTPEKHTLPPDPSSDVVTLPPPASKARKLELRALSKTFGHIPNVPIFSAWKTRLDCSNSAVHRSSIAGICGSGKYGAYSLVLSGSYKDDEDGGDVVIYTGTGGRELWTKTIPPKRICFGPQTKDQSWEHRSNKALIMSFLTGNSVRLVRSSMCNSPYAPISGYRYDGLYKVAAYWTAKGRSGKNICRCRLERLLDQAPIPLRPIILPTSSKKRKEGLISKLGPTPSPAPTLYDTADEMDTGPDETSPGQLESSIGGRPEGLQGSSAVEFSAELDEDIKYPLPQPAPQQVPPRPTGALQVYRWNDKELKLVKISSSNAVRKQRMGGEEENRTEDDVATLVSSEDGGYINERMGTEWLSDSAHTDKAGESASLAKEN